MGWDRGGWYTWDRIDNAGRPSATEVHPEWQDLIVGDQLRAWSPGGLLAPWEVAALVHLMPSADDRMRQAVDAVFASSDGPETARQAVR
jgi:hypothetical protein